MKTRVLTFRQRCSASWNCVPASCSASASFRAARSSASDSRPAHSAPACSRAARPSSSASPRSSPTTCGHAGNEPWLAAAIPVENPYCSCKIPDLLRSTRPGDERAEPTRRHVMPCQRSPMAERVGKKIPRERWRVEARNSMPLEQFSERRRRSAERRRGVHRPNTPQKRDRNHRIKLLLVLALLRRQVRRRVLLRPSPRRDRLGPLRRQQLLGLIGLKAAQSEVIRAM